jgi:RimJ/RimL family protein N-acetyltransferase
MVDELLDVIIRPATVEDASQIAEVHVASWREAYSDVVAQEGIAELDVAGRTTRWRQLLEDVPRDTSVWVAEEGGQVIGFASLGPSRDEDAERSTYEIYTIYLEPHAWGHGVARELMRTVLGAVPGGSAVTLWVLAANERARHFYRRNGFVDDGIERLEEIGTGQHRQVRYRRG